MCHNAALCNREDGFQSFTAAQKNLLKVEHSVKQIFAYRKLVFAVHNKNDLHFEKKAVTLGVIQRASRPS